MMSATNSQVTQKRNTYKYTGRERGEANMAKQDQLGNLNEEHVVASCSIFTTFLQIFNFSK